MVDDGARAAVVLHDAPDMAFQASCAAHVPARGLRVVS